MAMLNNQMVFERVGEFTGSNLRPNFQRNSYSTSQPPPLPFWICVFFFDPNAQSQGPLLNMSTAPSEMVRNRPGGECFPFQWLMATDPKKYMEVS